jgi:hypothetical protein
MGLAWRLNRNPIISMVVKVIVTGALTWLSTVAKELYELRNLPATVQSLQEADVASIRDRAQIRSEVAGVKAGLCWEVFESPRARYEAGCPPKTAQEWALWQSDGRDTTPPSPVRPASPTPRYRP